MAKHKQYLHSTRDAIAVAQHYAKKTGRSWFTLGHHVAANPMFIVDAIGRKGYNHYEQLECKPDGTYELHKSNPG